MNKKAKKNQINKILKTSKKVKKVQGLTREVESLNKIISDTLYIQKGIAVDIKNFTLMSLPDDKELFDNHNNNQSMSINSGFQY